MDEPAPPGEEAEPGPPGGGGGEVDSQAAAYPAADFGVGAAAYPAQTYGGGYADYYNSYYYSAGKGPGLLCVCESPTHVVVEPERGVSHRSRGPIRGGVQTHALKEILVKSAPRSSVLAARLARSQQC